MEVKEPSISTTLMNFESKSDPFEAISPPLYQTATFKQVRSYDDTLPYFFLLISFDLLGIDEFSFTPFLKLENVKRKRRYAYIYITDKVCIFKVIYYIKYSFKFLRKLETFYSFITISCW